METLLLPFGFFLLRNRFSVYVASHRFVFIISTSNRLRLLLMSNISEQKLSLFQVELSKTSSSKRFSGKISIRIIPELFENGKRARDVKRNVDGMFFEDHIMLPLKLMNSREI